jgi:hypothetical protein
MKGIKRFKVSPHASQKVKTHAWIFSDRLIKSGFYIAHRAGVHSLACIKRILAMV